MNFMTLIQLKSDWENFKRNHPKFPKFISAISDSALSVGTVIEIHVTKDDDTDYKANIKLTAEDIEFISKLKDIVQNSQES